MIFLHFFRLQKSLPVRRLRPLGGSSVPGGLLVQFICSYDTTLWDDRSTK